ncbi:MAG: F0F1 ATP synthase subunit A [Actinomycetota bacterium]
MEEGTFKVLEHFHLKVLVPIKVFGIDISITNLTVSMAGAAVLSFALFYFLVMRPKIIPGKRQTVAEFIIYFIKKYLVYNMMGKKAGDKWWPFVAGIFVFVLSNNLIGLIPGVYIPTANPVVPLTLAVIVFFTVQITNVVQNGFRGMVRTFAPSAVPSWMYVIVVPIEIVSEVAKPFSMFLRLFANMLAGHVIIFVTLGLIIYFKNYFIALASVPFAVAMNVFEIFVGAIQAYIFAVLSSMYIGEAISEKH